MMRLLPRTMRRTGKLTGDRPADALRQPAHVNLDDATVLRAAEHEFDGRKAVTFHGRCPYNPERQVILKRPTPVVKENVRWKRGRIRLGIADRGWGGRRGCSTRCARPRGGCTTASAPRTPTFGGSNSSSCTMASDTR